MPVIAIAWLYVVLMASLVEATGSGGTLLGAAMTFALYGVLPLAIVMYLMLGPARRRARRAVESAASASASASAMAIDPDQRSHTAGDTIAPEGKEP